MIKILRSLIHEKFCPELRVKLDLLSRRRDIVNKEKQDELFKLLREYKIQNLVPLGPGTNRYAFKLDGFVIKFATDKDGKIDNMKEFKMAKRLFPYVIKVHEISENGCLMVCEYIQPFEAFTQMVMYQDKIRAILKKLSSVYLIGDVGITEKNFRNWGLRVGATEPCCLDFAYVYDVKSKIFVCYACNSNSIIVPNNNFTELVCTNPNCRKSYLFEDIRRKISSSEHLAEIGNLTEEGYLLSTSNVPTELDTMRSSYLIKKLPKEENKKEENIVETVEDDFEMDEELK